MPLTQNDQKIDQGLENHISMMIDMNIAEDELQPENSKIGLGLGHMDMIDHDPMDMIDHVVGTNINHIIPIIEIIVVTVGTIVAIVGISMMTGTGEATAMIGTVDLERGRIVVTNTIEVEVDHRIGIKVVISIVEIAVVAMTDVITTPTTTENTVKATGVVV